MRVSNFCALFTFTNRQIFKAPAADNVAVAGRDHLITLLHGYPTCLDRLRPVSTIVSRAGAGAREEGHRWNIAANQPVIRDSETLMRDCEQYRRSLRSSHVRVRRFQAIGIRYSTAHTLGDNWAGVVNRSCTDVVSGRGQFEVSAVGKHSRRCLFDVISCSTGQLACQLFYCVVHR
ncbi:hypothetical protein J6590_026443 [Homalodisca vitripennis]|nr:hypothetical protein J6590_026443 [Homalodisca vitripennis]